MEEKDRENKEEKVEEKTNKTKNIRHTIVEYLTTAVVTICVVFFVYEVVIINAYIPSESMENTLMTGDRIIGNRLAYKLGNDPERFDIVIFDAPDNQPGYYIKRIIGLPGEKVTIKNGKVYINDNPEPLDDSFIMEEMDEEDEITFEVPENSYFMLGDNRNSSNDSRRWEYPYVPREDIVAKASFRYWKGFKWVK